MKCLLHIKATELIDNIQLYITDEFEPIPEERRDCDKKTETTTDDLSLDN